MLSNDFCFEDARGDIDIVFILPLWAFGSFGEANSPFQGSEATLEKKNEVLMVGVRGVRNQQQNQLVLLQHAHALKIQYLFLLTSPPGIWEDQQ